MACADSKFEKVISALEGLTDVLKKGFADVAVVKDRMERILPKLTNQAADMDSCNKVRLSMVKVRQKFSYLSIQRRLCRCSHCNTPSDLLYLQGSSVACLVCCIT